MASGAHPTSGEAIESAVAFGWPSPQRLAAVGAGGAAGASARWLVGELLGAPTVAAWPWATLIVNLVGCVVIGVAARRVAEGSLRWDALVTGVLGGFTTMSAFAVELNDLAEAGRTAVAIGYGAVTLIGGVGAVAIASWQRPWRRPGRRS